MSPASAQPRAYPVTSGAAARYLGLHVGIVVVLQQERRRLGVVLPGSDVQSW